MNIDVSKVQAFHGHLCPGLAIGIRVAEQALLEMGERPGDFEEVVALVETNNWCRGCHPIHHRLYLWKGQPDLPGLRQERFPIHTAQRQQGDPHCDETGCDKTCRRRRKRIDEACPRR